MTFIFRILGVVALTGAAILALFGDSRGAVAAVLVAGGAFLSSPGASLGDQNRAWLGLALICGGIATLVGSLTVAIVLLGLVVMLRVVATLLSWRVVSRARFEAVAPGAVMAGAEQAVAEFTSAGFENIGGHRVQLGSRPIVVTALLHPDADRMAFATDRVWQVTSRYGHRWLVTSNSGVAPLPATVLRQRLDGGRPADLVLAHARGVGMLRARGVEPDRFASAVEALQAARELEQRAIDFMKRRVARTAMMVELSSAADGPLVEGNSRSLARIDSWLNAAAGSPN
jgi:hypothetical protein